ncbi:PQQ-dependent sugar dehydrogenase [Croceitalea sp. MTPC9]|uniref:PQQ-dependent sugar dehydrogenase n=1 Tax=unclassified Croceitalea TaxID=2632280 RepID=UPI002B3C35F9|nr:PQQ-dependent sugar dehydrogenase [Croceitalea sp. MTPC6]GMN16278.1 PQQ-dependent sugar dehydrogenase [Croceitalea sp. MTPC9]
MKFLKTVALASIFLLFSCETEEFNSNLNDEMDDTGEEMSSESIVLVNAFPNLSFTQPLDLQSPEDGSNRIFIGEKGGAIKVFDNDSDATETSVFLDLRGTISTSSEQGLLGFAFHPSFQSNGYVYVCYTPTERLSVISRFTVSSTNQNTVDLASELVIIEIPQPATNHNGGQIAFHTDGYLYIAMGDGGGSGDPDGNAQNRTNLLGNILRIDVDNTQPGLNYAVPTDNPFINDTSVRDEIFAYGFRNPWRMSFDTTTGKLWTGDVGQNEIEEIDVVEIGGNYGWKLFEGTSCFSGNCDDTNFIPPIFEYNQDNGDRSITGGCVYRGDAITTLQGKYVYGDFVSGRIWALTGDGSANELLLESGLNIASFGTDADQELFVCTFDGNIYKFIVEEN